MKLAIAVILALVCHMTFADPAVKKVCDSTKQYFNGNACVDCKAPCKECVFKNGKESCINCGVDTGLFLEIKDDIGQCGNCTGNCTACRGSKASDCATPATTFKVSPSAVVKCEKAGCLWCKEENKCGKCEVGFRLENDTCTACQSPSCVDCSDSVSTCKKCAYFTKLNNNTCEPCAAGCTGCPCTACNPGYAFANNSCTRCNDLSCVACAGNTSVCTACIKGTFLDNETCKSCDADCKECTGTDKCSKCSSKFALKEGKCVACPTDCDECNPDGECTKCKKNFYASSDKKTCTACPAGCDECGAEGVCTKCLAGYLPKTDKKGCEACTTSGNCQECTNTTSCKTCQDGYNPDGKGQCKSIMSCSRGQALDGTGTCFDGTVDNCAYGNNITQSCYYCAEGYYAKDKTCTPCPNGCKSCSASSKGYVYCFTLAQTGFSSKTESNGKGDKTGYLGQNLVYTIKSNGDDDTCMPNTWAATYTKEFTKHKCLDYDKCPILRKSGAWECYIEGNAVKMTLSLFAIVVASLFTL